ncbi:MAG: hypothetical protein ABSB01_24355 [Streptosporangiaceae bacterium]
MHDLRDHLEVRYGCRAARISSLAAEVFRVERRQGPDWVARVFDPMRTVADAEADAQILRAGAGRIPGRAVRRRAAAAGLRADPPPA